jgi:uncharacterized protein (TIGR02145 family)
MTSLLFQFCGQNGNSQGGNSEDSYKTTTIGKQTWMSENLNVDCFQNGDPVPEAKSIEEWITAYEEQRPIYCHFKFDKEYGKKYGKLYNGFAIMDERGLAPKGFHIPNEGEVISMLKSMGEFDETFKRMRIFENKNLGDYLRDKDSWKVSADHNLDGEVNSEDSIYYFNKITETNSVKVTLKAMRSMLLGEPVAKDSVKVKNTQNYGFNALPAGVCGAKDVFRNKEKFLNKEKSFFTGEGAMTIFWVKKLKDTSNKYNTGLILDAFYAQDFGGEAGPGLGLSVRCLRD